MIKIHTLDNGLRWVGEEISHVRSVSVGIWVGTGARHEAKEEAGTSHFLEHMLFKGTKKRSAKDIAVEMDAIGGQINAFTAKECTCYYVKVMDEHLEKAMDILCDLVTDSVLSKEEIEREKGVVIEEIAMTLDTPEDLAHELCSEIYWQKNVLGKSVLGSQKTVGAFTQGMLQDYMDRRYRADNIVVAVAGHYDKHVFGGMVEKYLGDLPGGLVPVGENNKPFVAKPHVKYKAKKTEQNHICMSMPGVPMGDGRIYSLNLLSATLGGSMSSRLFQKIREERGLAYSVYAYASVYTDGGSLNIYAGTNPAQTGEVLSLILAEMRDIAKNGITADELSQSREQFKGNYILGLESVSSRMSSLGRSLLLRGEILTEEKVLRSVAEVTDGDVKDLAAELLDEDKLTTVIVGQVKDKAQYDAIIGGNHG